MDKTERLADPLGSCWIRLKRGKVLLTDDAIEAFSAVLMLFLTESASAEVASERNASESGRSQQSGQARYFQNVRGFLRTAYPRIRQRMSAREIEGMTLLVKQIGGELGN